jgi:hypothetical protein
MTELPDPTDRLDSWKEIAAFLRRTVRTVQRWEKSAGLPVHRGGPGQRHPVVASKREVSDWWQRRGSALPLEEAGDERHEPEPEPATDEPPVPTAEPGAHQPDRLRPAGMLAGLAAVVLTMALVGGSRGSSDPAGRVAGPGIMGRLLSAATTEGAGRVLIALDGEPGALAVSPDGRHLFVAMPRARALAVVDLDTRATVATVPLPDRPGPLAVSPAGSALYVAGDAGLTVVDVTTRTVARFLPVGIVYDMAFSADGRRLFLAHGRGGLKFIDLATGAVTPRPSIGCPMYLTAARRTRRIFIAYQCMGPGGRWGHDAIEAIDDRTGASLLVTSGPPLVGHYMTLSPDEQFLWADAHGACADKGYDHVGCPAGRGAVLHVFRADTLGLLLTVALPSPNFGAIPEYFPDGSRVVARAQGLWVINAERGHVEESLVVPHDWGWAFAPDRRRAFVSLASTKGVLALAVSPAQDARYLPGLGVYWPGDGSADDTVGGMHGVDAGPAAYAPGRYGQAFSFGPDKAAVSFGTRSDVDLTEQLFTLAAWIKPAHAGAVGILNRASFAGWQWSVTSSGAIAFCFMRAPVALSCGTGGVVSSAVVEAGRWHHVAVARSDTALTVFVDGRAEGKVSLAGYVPPPSSGYDEPPVTWLGTGPTTDTAFAGLVDEVTIFRRALSEDEIRRLMALTTLPQK